MLSIPLEQQLELSKQSQKGPAKEPATQQLAEAGLEEALTAGVSLVREVQQALELQPEDPLALAPPLTPPAADDAPRSCEQLSLFSFVALRLTRRTAEDADDFLPDQPVPTLRQAEGTDTLSRLQLCETRLTAKIAEMQAQVSLLSLMDPGEQ